MTIMIITWLMAFSAETLLTLNLSLSQTWRSNILIFNHNKDTKIYGHFPAKFLL